MIIKICLSVFDMVQVDDYPCSANQSALHAYRKYLVIILHQDIAKSRKESTKMTFLGIEGILIYGTQDIFRNGIVKKSTGKESLM